MLPVRLRGHSESLAVDTVRGVGFRAVCTCDWRGGVRASYRLALWEGRWHARA